MAKIELKPLPPEEAVRYFRGKGLRPSFAWQDVWQEEHAKALTVAKVMRLDLLEDFRAALDGAIADGTTRADFDKTLTPTLQAKGWWGRQRMTDAQTGEAKLVQLGSPRRLRTIFDTNLRTAYAAGKWERIQAVKEARPYLRYVHVHGERYPRPQHLAWNGTVLPVDDEFWKTHYPPNGWGCKCSVQQFSKAELDDEGFSVSGSAPPSPMRPWKNVRTGKTIEVPDGIDPGFGYNVGEAALRPVSPPPLDGLPTPFPKMQGLPKLPPPTPVAESELLPAGRPNSFYAEKFLATFGATVEKPAVFEDAIGERLPVSAELFKDANGAWKAKKLGRERYMSLLAGTLKDPDEIWWTWEKDRGADGQYRLKRRYLRRWDIEGQPAGGLTVFEWAKDGWKAATVFSPKSGKPQQRIDRYLEGQRTGVLAYRRPTEKR